MTVEERVDSFDKSFISYKGWYKEVSPQEHIEHYVNWNAIGYVNLAIIELAKDENV